MMSDGVASILHAWALRRRAAWLACALASVLVAASWSARAEAVIGNGNAASETRSAAGGFSAIGLSGSIALELRQGSPAAIVVHADANLLPLLETVLDNGELKVRWKRGSSVRSSSRAWVDVTAPQIRAVSSAGSGDIAIDAMKAPRLVLSVHGSSNVRGKALQADELSLAIAGSGQATLAGRATRLNIDLSGSGGIDAAAMKADDVQISIAGSGDASVHAARTLSASIAGSGNVTYDGEPAVQRAVAGSGKVRKR
jgi:hypothetical protein